MPVGFDPDCRARAVDAGPAPSLRLERALRGAGRRAALVDRHRRLGPAVQHSGRRRSQRRRQRRRVPARSRARHAGRPRVERRPQHRHACRVRPPSICGSAGGSASAAAARVDGIFEVFNLFNRTNYTEINNIFGTGAYPNSAAPDLRAVHAGRAAAPDPAGAENRLLALGRRLDFAERLSADCTDYADVDWRHQVRAGPAAALVETAAPTTSLPRRTEGLWLAPLFQRVPPA